MVTNAKKNMVKGIRKRKSKSLKNRKNQINVFEYGKLCIEELMAYFVIV